MPRIPVYGVPGKIYRNRDFGLLEGAEDRCIELLTCSYDDGTSCMSDLIAGDDMRSLRDLLLNGTG